MIKDLIEIKFYKAGHWTLENESLMFSCKDLPTNQNALYSFVVEHEVVYVGKTTNTVRKRLSQYEKPHSSQKTNMKVHIEIHNALKNKRNVEIYVYVDYEPQTIGSFILNKPAVLEDSIIKEAFDLPPELKNLLVQIEKIEISLRDQINEQLNSISENPFGQFVPESTRTRTESKIKGHLKKFPGEKSEDYDSFRRKLNFLTLGELKDLVMKPDCWPQFKEQFGTPQNVEMRFNQMFTLRNQLAHNNELNEVMIKDGEAAILWFKSVLGIVLNHSDEQS